MVTQTPRFNLNKYSQGDDDWSHSDTIDFVDEHSIDKGPVADRPTTGDYDDQLYFATDQGLFWRWDSNASDWTTDAFGTESNRVPDTSYFDGVDANSVNTDTLEFDYQQPQDVTSSRTSGTFYQNDSNHPLFVMASVATGATADERGIARVHINTKVSNNRLFEEIAQTSDGSTAKASVSFPVPPSHYYKIDVPVGSLDKWIESEAGSSTN